MLISPVEGPWYMGDKPLVSLLEQGVAINFMPKAVSVGALKISYSVFVLMERLLGRGEFRLEDGYIAYACRWCEREFKKDCETVRRQALIRLPYCNEECSRYASTMRAAIKRVFRESDTSELDIGTLALRLGEQRRTKFTVETVARYIENSAVAVVHLPNGQYKLE